LSSPGGGWRQNPYDVPGGSYGSPGYYGPLPAPQPMQPYYGPGPQASPSSMAVTAIVLAVLTWAGFWCLTAIPGFLIARSELASIDAGRAPPSGRGLATAAYWMCLVNLVLIAIAGLAIAVVVFMTSVGHPR
jgi:hypothetical protein